MSLKSILQVILSIVLAIIAVCTLVLPAKFYNQTFTTGMCILAVILLIAMIVLHLMRDHSFYGLARVLLCLSLILLVGGVACDSFLGTVENVHLNSGDSQTFDEDGLKDQTLELESVTGTNDALVYHLSWTLPDNVTIHDTLSKGQPFRYKYVEVRLEEGNIVGGDFEVQNAFSSGMIHVGSIAFFVMALICPLLGRKRGEEQ